MHLRDLVIERTVMALVKVSSKELEKPEPRKRYRSSARLDQWTRGVSKIRMMQSGNDAPYQLEEGPRRLMHPSLRLW